MQINRKGKAQKRALVVTNRHVLNLMADNHSKCNRCIDLRAVHHLSTSRSAQEFVIHVSMEYDYHFKFEQAISTKFGTELSYGAPTLLDEVKLGLGLGLGFELSYGAPTLLDEVMVVYSRSSPVVYHHL